MNEPMGNMGNGKFYVYVWYNEDWKTFFYVGKGSGNRYCSRAGRSIQFKAIVLHYHCKPYLYLTGLTEEQALKYEILVKKRLTLGGCPIIDMEANAGHGLAQREGIAAAKAKGKHWGHFRAVPDGYAEYCRRVQSGELTVTQAAKELGISRRTWYNLKTA